MVYTLPGIVRGIDVQRGLLYVITPVPVDCLQNIDLLLQGLIDIPRSIMQVNMLALGIVYQAQ
jgi:polynucleotide 5'-hydroxyl-kinase GRC3/NOL9